MRSYAKNERTRRSTVEALVSDVLYEAAKLLAPEGEGIEAPIEKPALINPVETLVGDEGYDKDVPADFGDENIAHKSPASPSPEPAREALDVLLEIHELALSIALNESDAQVRHQAIAYAADQALVAHGVLRIATVEPPAHEEGSTNG